MDGKETDDKVAHSQQPADSAADNNNAVLIGCGSHRLVFIMQMYQQQQQQLSTAEN